MFERRKNAMCRAIDNYGSANLSFVNSLPQNLRTAYNEITALPHFHVNAMLATCEGFRSHLWKWTRLTSDVKQSITSFFNQPLVMNGVEMRRVPKKMLTMIESNYAKEKFPNLTMEVKQVLCRNLGKEDCIIRWNILDKMDCQSVIMLNGTADDMDSILNFNDYTHWNRDTWAISFNYTVKKLKPRHFEEAPIDVVMDSMNTLSESCGNFSARTVDIITNRIVSNVESMSSIPGTVNDNLMNLLQECGADPSKFKRVYDDSVILSTMDVSHVSPRNAMKFIEDIPTFDPSTLTRAQIPRLINAMNRKQLRRLDVTEMEFALCDLCQTTFGRLQRRKKKVVTEVFRKKIPGLTNPQNLNATTAECMKCMIPYLPVSIFKNIPADVMTTMVSGNILKEMDITNREQARALLPLTKSLYNKANGGFTSENLRQMGPRVCLKALNATDFDAIPTDSYDLDLLNSFDESLREDISIGTRAIMNKLKRKFQTQLGTKKLLRSKFAQTISPADIESMPSADILDVMSSGSELLVSAKQSRTLMKKIKQESGSSGFDLQTIKDLGSVVCGFTVSDIANFAKDSTYVDILNAIANNHCPAQLRELHRLRKEYMDFDNIPAATLTADTTSATIGDISPQILLMHSKDELIKYGTQVCTDILGSIQSLDVKDLLTKAELQDLWNYFLACKGKQTTGTISQDDLDLAGNLLCGIASSDITRINTTAIETNIRMIDECTTLGKTERDAALSLYTTVKGITTGTQVKATTLIDLGTLATALPTNIIDTIPPEILAEGAPSSMEAIEIKKGFLHIRKKAGFKNDITSDEQADSDKLEKYFEAKCVTALETTSDTSRRRRRRRSTASLTCADMQLLGTSGLSALTTTQISNLADQEFIDCAETLGSVTGYSKAQKDALLVVATRATVWGGPASWLTTDIYNAGVICQAMTVAQINSLNLDLDTVSRLGQFDDWETLKKKAVFNRWLSQHKSGDSSTITSSELRSLGHITCGAETSHINSIQQSVYQGAVDSIGELTSCDGSQLQAFVALAKTAYGSDVTTWDATVITNVGTTIGELSASDIGSLSSLQIDVVDPNHVSYIPSSIFAGFTVDQIRSFSPAQAQSTSSSQRAVLTSAQLDALSTVASITWKAAGSGGSVVMTSWPVTGLIATLMLSYLL